MAFTPEELKKLEAAGLGITPPSSNFPTTSLVDRLKARRNQAKDQQSAESNLAVFPAKTGESPMAAGLKATGNLPSSILNLGKGIVQAAASPIKTVKGIGSTLAGAGESLGRTIIDKTAFGNIKTPSGTTLRENLQKLQPSLNEQTFDKIVDSLNERYGSIENAQRTATNDPFGFGADVMAVLSGGAGLARKIAPGAIESATRATEAITKPISELNTLTREKAAGVLQKSAEKTMSQVLDPTKETFKVQTQQILPELTKRNNVALTQKGLLKQYDAQMEAAGQAIDDAWKALPPDTMEKVKPIVNALEDSKNNFIVNNTIVEPNAWKAADELQKIILEVSDNKDLIPSQSLRKVRQIWDDTIQKSKGFTKDLSEQDKIYIKKEATSAIRKVLAEAHPNIDKLNKEYTLWRKASDVLEETIQRKTGRGVAASDKVLAGIGGGSGFIGGGLATAAIGVGVVAALVAASKSTLWKTFSASKKAKLAEAILERNNVEIKKILLPIIGQQGVSTINDNVQE